jgi:hypothetical protein
VVSAASRVAVRAKVAAAVGLAPLGHAAAGASLLGGAKVLAVLALVVGGAAAVRHATRSPATGPAIPQAIATTTPAPSMPDVIPTTAPAPAMPEVIATVSGPTKITAPAPARVARLEPTPELTLARRVASDLPPSADAPQPAPEPSIAVTPVTRIDSSIAPASSQAELLRRAWAASSADDGAQALALVTQDEQLHPHGPLAEERDALRIAALAKLRRLDEARLAATRFLQRNPHSIHRALIERAIGAHPETP